jgi:small subunit ribosomal protein S16
MAVKLRLTRLGKKKKPVYRIVAIDGRSKRDGAALETLGTYDPIKDQLIQYHSERINYWLQQGAQASHAVKKISKLHASGKNTKEAAIASRQ